MGLLGIEFILALELHISPRDLDEMDYAEVVYLNIPITEARNTATLVEAAANDFKSKRLGYNSAEDFNEALNERIRKNARNDQ